MVRPHKPWYRTPRDTWYVQVDGQQVPLAKAGTAGPRPTRR